MSSFHTFHISVGHALRRHSTIVISEGSSLFETNPIHCIPFYLHFIIVRLISAGKPTTEVHTSPQGLR